MNLTKPTKGTKPTGGVQVTRSESGEISVSGSLGSNFGPISANVEADGSLGVQVKIPTPAPGLGVIAGAEINLRTGEIESVTGGITAGGIVNVTVTVEGCEILMLVEVATPLGISFGYGQKATLPGCEEEPPPPPPPLPSDEEPPIGEPLPSPSVPDYPDDCEMFVGMTIKAADSGRCNFFGEISWSVFSSVLKSTPISFDENENRVYFAHSQNSRYRDSAGFDEIRSYSGTSSFDLTTLKSRYESGDPSNNIVTVYGTWYEIKRDYLSPPLYVNPYTGGLYCQESASVSYSPVVLWSKNNCVPVDYSTPTQPPPPPPLPPIPPLPLPPCDCMNCCESLNATLRLTREIHKSLRADMFGQGIAAKVPEGMVRPGKSGIINLKDYVDVFEFLLRTIDRYLGKPPWSVFVEDTDPNTAGNQSLAFRFESIGEMLKSLLETEANKPAGSGSGGSSAASPESIVNIRTIFEIVIAILFEIGITHKLVAEIRAEQQEQTEALGYAVNDKTETIKFAFSPLAKALEEATAGSEEELQRVIPPLLKPSNIDIKYSGNEDEKTLYQLITEVNDLLKSIRGAFTSPVNSYKQFKGLMEGVEFGMDAAQLILLRQIRQALGNLPKNEFQDFMDNLEKRYTENQSPVASDQGKPFQQSVSNEPVIIVQEQKQEQK